jgi:hypothetical protein
MKGDFGWFGMSLEDNGTVPKSGMQATQNDDAEQSSKKARSDGRIRC